jgi:hypothetical protein
MDGKILFSSSQKESIILTMINDERLVILLFLPHDSRIKGGPETYNE